jgi:L-ascorbate metabolism protein UlaG (beta-lactamase superfamily)
MVSMINGIAAARSFGRNPEPASAHRRRTGILRREAMMNGSHAAFLFLMILLAGTAFGKEPQEKDVFPTGAGDLTVTFLGHGSLLFFFDGTTIAIDPYAKVADYGALPKADIILVTHEHGDHLDPGAIQAIRSDRTVVAANPAAAAKIPGALVLKNGDRKVFPGARKNSPGIPVIAVPAYNLVHERSPGVPFHPKGAGNGYVLTFGDKRVYVAGDTENIPEMKALAGVDVAFLPMNLPYTMTPEMVADAARVLRPKILYPYHFGETDTSRIVDLLRSREETEVRIRRMQ